MSPSISVLSKTVEMKHYDIDGNIIYVKTCRNCNNQVRVDTIFDYPSDEKCCSVPEYYTHQWDVEKVLEELKLLKE